MNYCVNYGVNHSHRKMNSQLFERYKDALKLYDSIDRSQWKSGEIVKLVYDEGGYVTERITKKEYDLWPY